MRIEGPDKTSSLKGASKTKKKESASGVSFSSLIEDMEETSSAADISASSAIGSLDALLAVQEDGGKGSKEANDRAKDRADNLINGLEGIRQGLLQGGISQHELQRMSDVLNKYRDRNIAPKLANLLDEIDLRVQVEIAKLTR